MKITTITIHETEYDLAATLRVAYEIQNKHNHESYMKIFSRINEMTLEQQIDILYVAFKIANPEVAKTFTGMMFREYYLDNYTVSDVMDQMNGVISGILGKDLDATTTDDSTASQGN